MLSFIAGVSLHTSVAIGQKNPFFPGSTEEYPQPVFFDVVGSGVDIEPLVLSYEMTDEKLSMGSLVMELDDFYVNMLTLKKSKTVVTEDVFVVRWPQFFMRTGLLEFISRNGQVLWKKNIDERDLEDWKATLGNWKTDVQFGVRSATAENSPLWEIKEPFRACLTKSAEQGQTRLCSAQFRVELINEKPKVFKVPRSPQPARVIINNKQTSLKQELPVEAGKPVQFYAELSDGSSYEFYAIPKKINLVDMTGNKEQTEAVVISEGEAPLQKTEIINKEEGSRFFEFIGWQQTIGDFRQYWRTRIPWGQTQIMLPGQGGGAFLQRMKVNFLPQENMRPFLSRHVVEGTYIDGTDLYLKKSSSTKVNSKQNKVILDSDSPNEIVWEFGAKKRGAMNRSHLLVSDGQQTYKAYHELFKGFPREISLRSTVAGTVQTQTFLGEAAFNYWFEDLFGWDHPVFAKQRWGLSSKYFQNITELRLGSIEGPFKVTNAELKYRLTPGMWARKETWGLIAGYQKVQYDATHDTTSALNTDYSAELIGFGGFWARSMPRIFDDIFNYFPFMKYPKWVDAEFIYYPAAMNTATEVGQGLAAGNFALNFHGQVMWSDRFFGEAGFGIKQYNFAFTIPPSTENPSGRKPRFTFGSLYTTVGIGYRF